MGPNLVPVGRDSRPGLHCRGKLQSTRGTVVIAGDGRVSGNCDRIAGKIVSKENDPISITAY